MSTQLAVAAKAFGPARKETTRVRVLKDALRLGTWMINREHGPQEWHVDAALLRSIERDFKTARANGVRANLIKGHGDSDGIVHPNDIIAPIDDVRVIGGELWISVYCDRQTAEWLKNPAMNVSVCVGPFSDGQGRHYGQFLKHVGVVDLPVVDSQLPFIAASLSSRSKGNSVHPKILKPLTNPDRGSRAPRRLSTAITLPSVATPDSIREVVQQLLTALGVEYDLPELGVDWLSDLRKIAAALEAMGRESPGKPAKAGRRGIAKDLADLDIADSLRGARATRRRGHPTEAAIRAWGGWPENIPAHLRRVVFGE
ncbi:MAG: hypothetical protein IT428_00105 [Planctomycetaceae bacterium]|nr:hypothetical protein [Planctomycetaceae bacterium]